MPFDGRGFERAASPASTAARQRRRAGSVFRRVMQTVLFLPSEEPIDAAVLRVLEEARGLIEDREEWMKGAYRTARGERCAVGALRSAAELLRYEAAGEIAHGVLTRVATERGFASIERMNDRSRHHDVLGAFDAAISAVVQRSDRERG